jgi:hypothetical protein
MGEERDGDITLRLTVLVTATANSGPFTLPDVHLAPGEFQQFNSILAASGLANAEGFVRVERVSGKAPYYAYAVINDQVTSDGSYISPIRADAISYSSSLFIPAVVETGSFASELILTNTSSGFRNLALHNMSDAIQSSGQEAIVDDVPLQAGEQRIIGNYVQWARDNQGLLPVDIGSPYTGFLLITPGSGGFYGLSGVFAGVRVSATNGRGHYGVYYPAVPFDSLTTREAWIYGLQQNSTNRSNLALADAFDNPVKIDLFDGDSGQRVSTFEVSNPGIWTQLNSILAQYAPGVTQGYARISPAIAGRWFITYGVINDGAAPGQRTGDGAFIASSP